MAGGHGANRQEGCADMENSKSVFFFCMTVCNHRTGVPLGKRCGIVFAGSGEEAERIASEKYGNDASCQLWIAQVPEDGFEFTVYKGEI